MTGKLKIKQLAELTQLSTSTVSRVLSGKSNVSPQAKEKVFTHAKLLGILHNMPAGRLLMNSILVCAPAKAFTPLGDRYYYEVIQSIASEIEHYDIRLSKCSLEVNGADISSFIKLINKEDIDAIIIIGIDDAMVYKLASESNKLAITINAKDKEMRLDSISPDHYSSSYSAATYLFQKGHRPVLLFTDLRRDTMLLRLDGFKRACLDHHVFFDESEHLLVNKGYEAEEAKLAFEKYLQNRARETLPSAILCGSNTIAQAVIDVFEQHGIQVPDDVSVMSLDFNIGIKKTNSLDITSVYLPCRELGRESVYILQSRLTRPVRTAFNLLLQSQFYIGNSVADVNWKRKDLYQHSPNDA
ncbi:LacI family DNA-binding transcriptional regulator [Hafnia paralvei]|uniref:LacI family DNA-binding transcriptional regulator n=1 Tax=Hafnia paralvei TaxID=546367 RepID=UPI003C2DFAAB